MREFIKINETKRGKSKKMKIDIKRYLTIDDTTELRIKLLKEFKTSTDIEFTLKEMESIDVSGIQLLLASYRKAKEMDIPCKISIEMNPELTLLMKNSGIDEIFNELQINKSVN